LVEVSAEQAAMWAERTWAELGFPAADVVTVRAGAAAAHYAVNVSGLFGPSWAARAQGEHTGTG
jgi:hypothetical protein